MDYYAYYALLYDVVDGFVARRAPYRTEHLGLAREAQGRGELLLAGALGDPPDGALLVFRAPNRSVVEEFARSDPYVTNGLVTRWQVRPWAVVVGGASDPAPGTDRSRGG
jgi:uncharacterized protein YciI